MANTDPLYLLIKSLYKGDKDNFIRNAKNKSRRAQVKYVDFFRAVNQQHEYQEAELKKLLEIPNFPEAKRRLIEQILDSLIHFDDNINDSLTIEKFKIEELYHRGIFNLALKRLKKALRKAYDEEKFLVVIELSDLMNRILLENEEYDKLGNELTSKFLGRDVARDQLSNLLAYKDLFNHFFPTFKKHHTARGQVEMEMIDKLDQHPLLSGPNMAISNRAKIYFYRLKYIISFFQADYQNSLDCSTQIIEIFNEHTHLIAEDPKLYIQEVGKQSSLLFFFEKTEEGLQTLENLNQIKPNSKKLGAEIFEWIQKGKITYSLQTNKPDIILSQIEEIKKGLKLYEGHLKFEALYVLYFSLCQVYYKIGRLSEAVKWVKFIVDNPHPEIRNDIQSVSRIILLLLYFDMDEFSLVESFSRSTTKYLKKAGKLYRFEARMLKFTRSFPLPEAKHAQIEVYTSLKEDLLKIFKQPFEGKVLGYFDFIEWIDQRIIALGGKV